MMPSFVSCVVSLSFSVCVCVCVCMLQSCRAGSVPECTKERLMFSFWLIFLLFISSFSLFVFSAFFLKNKHCAKGETRSSCAKYLRSLKCCNNNRRMCSQYAAYKEVVRRVGELAVSR